MRDLLSSVRDAYDDPGLDVTGAAPGLWCITFTRPPVGGGLPANGATPSEALWCALAEGLRAKVARLEQAMADDLECTIEKARGHDAADWLAHVLSLLAEHEEMEARIVRLQRILAVECGDESAAPEGWRRAHGDWRGPGDCWVVRWGPGCWVFSTDSGWSLDEYSFALEAIEAADAARHNPGPS